MDYNRLKHEFYEVHIVPQFLIGIYQKLEKYIVMITGEYRGS